MASIPPRSRRLPIDLGERSYDILVGHGVLDDPASYAGLPPAAGALVVTNPTVAGLYGERLVSALRGAGLYERIETAVLPEGESFKTLETLNQVFDALLRGGFDRGTTLYALGGGVIGDMTGFAAACYMRGVPCVQVPTTLLAQVDSSVGGKTAVNHALGKNMIGVFSQPLRVVADTAVLSTLPPRELAAGLAEVIKYGPIADADFLDWIDAHLPDLLALDAESLHHAIRRSCEIKASVVAVDEREAGLRAILNFGHTFGHAIEAGLGFGTWLHGEAVGCGMVMAAELSVRLGLLSGGDARRLRGIVERAGLPVQGPALGAERWLPLMRLDKKSQAGEIRFVLLDGIGRAVVRGAPDATVRAVIEATTG